MSTLDEARSGWTQVIDLVGLCCLTVLVTICAVLSPPFWSVLGPLCTLGVLLLGPGYAIVALLYPTIPETGTDSRHRQPAAVRQWVIDVPVLTTVERLALALATSVVCLPLVSAVIFVLTGHLSGPLLRWTVASLTVLVGVGALARRLSAPPEKRYAVPVGRLQSALLGDGGVRSLLNVLLAMALIVSVAGLGYALVVPQGSGEPYTSLALLSETDDGNLVAGDYPQTFERGEARPVTVRVVNQEGHPASYTLVVAIERLGAGDSSPVVVDRRIDHRTEIDLEPGEDWTRRQSVAPNMTGDRLRLHYQLYRTTGSKSDTAGPYRRATLWIDVRERSEPVPVGRR